MATENKQEKPKDRPFIKWLNKAGKAWKDFWDTPVTIQYAYNPHAVVGNGGTPFSTTQRRGDFAKQTAVAVAIPATAAGVATVGVVPTLVGIGAGMGAGIAADVGGSKLVELAGGDGNAQEMVGDIAGFTFGALAGGKATKATTNYLNFWNSWLNPKSVYTAMAEGMTPISNQNYGLVKYYGPTMGKTTAAKTNPKLVDFDDIVRDPIAKLAAKKGVTPRDLKIANDPDYISLLETEVARWRMNPANAGKTLVISNKALSSATTGYNNQPSIPDKETFIARQVQRGGNREEAAAYYDALIENNPNLKIDNRFVSDIESGTRTAQISEAERLGIPKGTKYYTQEENLAFRNQINDFAKKYGYEPIGDEVTDPEVLERYARSLIKRHNTFYRGVELNPQESNLSLEYMATHAPGGGAGELYITPYQSVAAMYGEPVEILRPYKLGADRTKWFDEGNFPIYTAGGRRDIHLWENKKGISAPWLTSETFEGKSDWIYKPRVETELTGRNQQFIPISVQYRNIHPHLQPLDRVGSLAVPTTAFYKSGGSIHIKKKNRGKFTKSAKAAGEGVQEHAHKVMNDPNATPLQKKRANFAIQAKKWHRKHQLGGKINYLDIFA